MSIRELDERDAREYRRLRLRALKEHPTAFSSSYEEQRGRPLDAFAGRLREAREGGDSFLLGCFRGASLIGTVGFFREQGPQRRHWGVITHMHVAAEHQRRGHGRALLAAALDRARGTPGLTLVRLAVESTNDAARSLYQSIGFERYGTERDALLVDGTFYDQDLMVLRLDAGGGGSRAPGR